MPKRLFLANLQKRGPFDAWAHISAVRTFAATDDKDLFDKLEKEYKPLKDRAPDFRVRVREVQVISEDFVS